MLWSMLFNKEIDVTPPLFLKNDPAVIVKPTPTTANIGKVESTMSNKSFSDPTDSKNEPTASPQLFKLMKDYREDLWPDKASTRS